MKMPASGETGVEPQSGSADHSSPPGETPMTTGRASSMVSHMLPTRDRPVAAPYGPLDAQTFAEHLPLAIQGARDEAHPLALVVVRAVCGKRGRRRVYEALREADA